MPVDAAVRRWLRAEGLAVLAVSVLLYARYGGGWIVFAALFLVPDVSFAGYLGGARVGAAVYNTAHSYVLPLGVILAGLIAGKHTPVAIALIWAAHIGFDRMLGYGLKYPSGFHDTHLGVIGPQARRPDGR